ncbi:MAG: SH3 domain-containing protein [Pseudobdellovibrionaceae bacterium]
MLFGFLLPLFAWGQAQQGTIVSEPAFVYQDADFDSPIIATLTPGAVYNISKGTKGPFYKIRIKPGTVGWIADTDIKPGVVKVPSKGSEKNTAKKQEEEKKSSPKKPFMAARYRGPVFDFINFTENTLGQGRTDSLLFYGVKFNGYDTLVEGEIYTEGNILFHVGAPKYYSEVTKRSADGFIFIADFLLETATALSKNRLFYYGFGPLFKYSHFNLDIPNGTKTISYTADDMSLGAAFNLGLAFRIGKTSLRTDVKYFWEKEKYPGLGLNLGFEF